MVDFNENDLTIPKEAHIPRPSGSIIETFTENLHHSEKWEDDFNKAMGNLLLKSTDSDNLVQCLKEAKINIEKVLYFFENLENSKNEEKKEIIYFDLPFPLPERVKKDSDENKQRKSTKETMSEWSREKIELCETIHENTAEIGRQYQIISSLEQENKEVSEKLKKVQKKKKEYKADIMFCNEKEKCLLSALESFVSKVEKDNAPITDGESFRGMKNKMDQPHGFGKLKNRGDTFFGFFENGKKSGFGKWKNKEGESYEGYWRDNQFDGFGILKNSTGEVYKGSFREGMKEGSGIYKGKNESYEGTWKGDERNGQGEAVYSDKSVYRGNWLLGFPHGEGELRSCDGNLYKGSWKEGVENGEGTWTAYDGLSYEGQWKDGRKHGIGIFSHSEGWTYNGEWKDGKKEGRGTISFKNAKYEGEWRDDCREGLGEYIFSNRDCYKGEWKANLADGKGVYFFADGASYEGEFRRGWPYGEGIFIFPSGARIQREWKEHLPEGYRVEVPWQKTMFR